MHLVDTLRYCLRNSRPNCRSFIGKVLVSLVPIRELTRLSNKALPKIQKDWIPNCELDPFWGQFIEDADKWEAQQI